MTREQVYLRIDSEREKQDSKWGGWEHDSKHDIASWITFMDYYLSEARAEVTFGNDNAALDNLRKVTALGVACFEVHGVSYPQFQINI